jgi:hypothetical protein
LIQETFGSGVKLEYEYDSANRLSVLKNTNCPISLVPIPPHMFNYDGLNRLVSATVGTNTIVRKYDSRGRLVLERCHGLDLEARYKDNMSTVEKQWPDGRIELHTYDLNNVISKIEQISSGQLGSNISSIASFKPW